MKIVLEAIRRRATGRLKLKQVTPDPGGDRGEHSSRHNSAGPAHQ